MTDAAQPETVDDPKAETPADPAPADEVVTQTQDADDGQQAADGEQPADDTGAPRSKGAERRIRQLTRNWRQTQRELQAERQKSQTVLQRLEEIEKRIPRPELQRPQRDAFESQEEYEDALFEWRDAKRTAGQDGEKPASNEPALTDEQKRVIEDFGDKLDDLDPDAFDAVMVKDWPCTPAMSEYIMAQDNGAELAFHLAQHHDIADKITKMSPILAARELDKVAEGLSKPKAETDSGAEKPPPPLSESRPTGGSAGLSNYGENLPADEWAKLRREGKI